VPAACEVLVLARAPCREGPRRPRRERRHAPRVATRSGVRGGPDPQKRCPRRRAGRDATSHTDPWKDGSLHGVHGPGLAGGVGSPPESVRLNELSTRYVFWAEEVRADPGEEGVAVRIFATNPTEAQGFWMGLRIDPGGGKDPELTVEGTATGPARYDQFLYQAPRARPRERRRRDSISTPAPPFGFRFPAGRRPARRLRHRGRSSRRARGTSIRVDLDGFGSPPALDASRSSKGIGPSPSNAESWMDGSSSAIARAAGGRPGGPRSSWAPGPWAPKEQRPWAPRTPSPRHRPVVANAAEYTGIRIERDGREDRRDPRRAYDVLRRPAGTGRAPLPRV